MASISIPLSAEQLARLRELAQQKGQTPEETLTQLVQSVLPEPTIASKSPSILDISGILTEDMGPIDWNRHDEWIAEEAWDTHAGSTH